MAGFAYQYLVGGILFLVTFVLAWRGGGYTWRRREDRLTGIMLIVVFALYFTGHLAWLLAARGGA